VRQLVDVMSKHSPEQTRELFLRYRGMGKSTWNYIAATLQKIELLPRNFTENSKTNRQFKNAGAGI
jgi:hypothetical protein